MSRTTRLAFCSLLVVTAVCMVIPGFVLDADTAGSLTLDNADYDHDSGKISFAGTTTAELVNISIVDSEDSMIASTAVTVVDGSFSDSLLVGDLKGDGYKLVASSNSLQAIMDISHSESLSIESVSYDYDSGTVSYSGLTTVGLINISILSAEGRELCKDAWSGTPGTFEGKVHIGPVSSGTLTLIASSNHLEDRAEFTVGKITVTLNKEEVSITALQTERLIAEVTDSDDPVVWSSSNELRVTVDRTGLLTAVSYGTATVTATVGNVSTSCNVTVKYAPAQLSESSIVMDRGDSRTLTVSISDGNAPDNCSWRAEDNNTLEITADGATAVLDAIGTGSNTVEVICDNLYYASCPVRIDEPPNLMESYTFFIKMEMDVELADLGSFSEDDLTSGITFTVEGYDAADALTRLCDSQDIQLHINSDPNDEFYGWIGSMFGLKSVQMSEDVWKYWVQYKDWNYNQWALGYYKDGGSFQLIYKATTMGDDDPVDPDKPPVNPDVPPVNPDKPPVGPDDKPLIDEETKTEVVENEDGSTTTTTTTTGKTEDGESVKVVDKVTEKDGVSTGTKTETVTDKDGNEIGNRVTESTKDKDGNTTSKTTATKTEEDGSKTSSTSESKLDKDGNGISTSESVTTKADGTSVSEKSTTERSEDKVTETKTQETKDARGQSTGKQTETKTQETLKDSEGNETGTLTAETKETVGKDGKSEKTEDVAVESKDGNVKTEATSKTDKDGNVKAETTTTVKSETKDVGADAIDTALKQSEQALSNISADKTKITKTVEVEVSSGTSAALSPEAVKKVSDYGAGLKVSVSEGSIDTDSDVLKNLAKDGKTVELSMEANNRDVLKDKQKDIVGDNHFVDLNALVGGENVHQLGGKAVITFSYQLKDGESAVDLKVFYVDDEGNKTLVDATFANGSFTMTVDHFSVYMVENTAAPAPVDPEDKDEGGISPVLIAGILVVIIAAIVGVVLYTRKN